MIIVLARHGEAVKNIEKRHGEVAESLCTLTTTGIRESHAAAERLRSLAPLLEEVLYTPRPQCRETAEIIARILGINTREFSRVPAYHLGILEGLSDHEVASRYPDLSKRMDEYRSGTRDLIDTQIPGATDPLEFYEIGLRSFGPLADRGSGFVLVASRSVLILCASILLGRRPVPGGRYREIPWGNSCFVSFSKTSNGWEYSQTSSNMSIPD